MEAVIEKAKRENELDLDFKKINLDEFYIIANSFGELKNIEIARLSCNELLGDEGIRIFCKGLRYFKSLKDLSYGCNNLTTAGLDFLVTHFWCLPNLKYLDLSGNIDLSVASLTNFIKNIYLLKSLETLHLLSSWKRSSLINEETLDILKNLLIQTILKYLPRFQCLSFCKDIYHSKYFKEKRTSLVGNLTKPAKRK